MAHLGHLEAWEGKVHGQTSTADTAGVEAKDVHWGEEHAERTEKTMPETKKTAGM